MILVRCLGPPEMTVDGRAPPRELLWRKNVALLVYLARSPGRSRTRTHLAGLLWGGSPEGAARHSLNEALRVLRRQGGEALVRSEGRDVVVSADELRLDTGILEKRLEAGEAEEAAALVRGQFLEGFEVPDASRLEDWLSAERTYWRRRSVEALAGCAEGRTDAGDPEAGLRAAIRALELDSFSDTAVRAALRSTALSGERAAALELYEEFAARLREELGTRPEAETERLARRIRLERSWRLPDDIAPEAAASRRLPLVGRDEELEAALELWRETRAGETAGALVVEGRPGVGKSRFLEELAARARLEGAVVLGARSVRGDRDDLGAGLHALASGGLLDAPGLVAAPAGALAGLARAAPGWGERFREEIDGAEPLSLARSVAALVCTVAEEQPVLLVLDDAHWLDPESAAGLQQILRDTADRPVLAALGMERRHGDHPLAELQAELGRELRGRTLRLEPLGPAPLVEMARQVLPEYGEKQLRRLARRLRADSAGIPLLANEILQAVRLGLELEEGVDGPWPREDRTLDETLPGDLPDSVVAAVRVGFRELTPVAQEALTAASLLGERLDAATLAEATGRDRSELEPALDELEWGRWLESDPRGYTFVARIVREVIAEDMLTPGQRRRIRKRAATS